MLDGATTWSRQFKSCFRLTLPLFQTFISFFTQSLQTVVLFLTHSSFFTQKTFGSGEIQTIHLPV